ncbi:MAG: AEC family transporter [bacterium]|jgi:hypothetical protein|nr:AEC family transporter [bacterium]
MLPWIPVFLGCGWLARRRGWQAERLSTWLSAWALRVALPATVLKVLAGMPLSQLNHPAVWLPWLLLILVLPLLWFSLRRVPFLDAEQARLLLLLIPLGNTSFLGLPLLQAVRGDEALSSALLYDQFGSFPQLLLLGTWLLESHAGAAGSGQSGSRRGHPGQVVVRRLASFPPLPVLLLALSPAGPWLRDAAEPLLSLVAWTLVPTVMVALGARLRIRLLPKDRPALALGLMGKMVVVPALALLVAWLLDWRSPEVQVALLESAMPPMATAAAWAGDRGLCPSLGAALVSAGIIVALVWIPLLSLGLTWWMGS